MNVLRLFVAITVVCSTLAARTGLARGDDLVWPTDAYVDSRAPRDLVARYSAIKHRCAHPSQPEECGLYLNNARKPGTYGPETLVVTVSVRLNRRVGGQ